MELITETIALHNVKRHIYRDVYETADSVCFSFSSLRYSLALGLVGACNIVSRRQLHSLELALDDIIIEEDGKEIAFVFRWHWHWLRQNGIHTFVRLSESEYSKHAPVQGPSASIEMNDKR